MSSLTAASAAPIADDSIVRRAVGCTSRVQVDQVLIYNPKTDELHLIPTDAYQIVELCESGIRAGTIIDMVASAACVDRSEAAVAVVDFIQSLEVRGILEIETNE